MALAPWGLVESVIRGVAPLFVWNCCRVLRTLERERLDVHASLALRRDCGVAVVGSLLLPAWKPFLLPGVCKWPGERFSSSCGVNET